MQPILLSQFVYSIYIPILIAFMSLTIPIVTILLSIFTQGRLDISNIYREQIGKINQKIKANELNEESFTTSFLWQLFYKHYKLTLLNPSSCLLLLVFTLFLSIIFSTLAVAQHLYTWGSISLFFLSLFIFFLWSLTKLMVEITSSQENKKEERERNTLETLQNIFKACDPESLIVKKVGMTINGVKATEGLLLPSATIGKELSLHFSFDNDEKDLAAKNVELGIRFPVESFQVIKKSYYELYEADNTVRFNNEYVQKNTNIIFPEPLIIIPKRTGTYEITSWIRGENIKTKYFDLKIKVEIEI